jgi:TRAP-type uncharacterized transport system substrate-binding protein
MPRFQKDLGLLIIAVLFIAASLYFWVGASNKPKTIHLRLTAGDRSGLRHRLATEFAREASKSGIEITVEPTEGTEVALEKLARHDFDIALVQGGLTSDPNSPIRQLSALHTEPLHLLVKPELQAAILAHGLSVLAGHQVNLGSKGSGTNLLAAEVLRFAGLRSHATSDATDYSPNYLNYTELLTKDFADLPDAVFTVSSLPSPIADFLTDKHAYQLVPLKFGEALSLEAFLDLGTVPASRSIDKQHVYSTTIPAFTYSVEPPSPPEPLQTVGTRLLLVAHQSVDPEQVKRLLECLYRSNLIKAERPVIDATILDLPTEFPMHRGAELYRQRNKPIIAGDAVDFVEKMLAISATVAGGLFFVVQWYLRTSRRKQEASFAIYMERVMAIENESMKNELAAELDLATLIRLQKELSELKSEAVSKFAAGKLEGEGLIHGFLAMVNDARNQLTRLILHQRENIEEIAEAQNHSVDEVWREQSRAPSPPRT